MKTLLITGIGSDISQGVAKIVREVRPDWKIVGVDIHTRHGGRHVADAVEVVVRADASSYLECMQQVVARHDVDFCLPISEAELAVIHKEGISAFGTAPIIGVAHEAIEIGLDKLKTVRFIEQLGIAVPWTLTAQELARVPAYPCIFKPRRSAGSKGIFICKDEKEAQWLRSREEHGIFQELLLPANQEITCAVYRDRNGHTEVLPMLRELVGGFTGWAQVIDAPEVVGQCVAIADALDLHGAINIQLRLTASGPRIFEINPRFSSTVFLRHLLGFRDLQWMLEENEGLEITYEKVPEGTIAVRTQGAVVLGR